MSLTRAHGPLSGRPPASVNYTIDGPPHRLLMHPFPRRVRAELGGETVLDSTRAELVHETGPLPQLYVPADDVRRELLEPTDLRTHCPFKGDASYWSVRAGEALADNAAWGYPEPIDGAGWLLGQLGFYWGKMDRWLDEDEEVNGHLRDPYARVDVRASSRHVEVLAGGKLVADTRRPTLLSENGLPNRWYVPLADVRADVLEPSESHSVCPYKGTASYRSVVVDGRRLEDVAWFYPEPFDGVRAIEGHLCFLGEEIETRVDGAKI